MKKFLLAIFLLGNSVLWAQSLNMNLISHFEYSDELSDVWGYVDEDGNEYALVGRQYGVSIVNITDSSDVFEVFSLPGPGSTWRDLKTWGDYMYVTCESGPALLIVDMTSLPDSNNLPYTFWLGDTMTFQSAHNLYIDEKGYCYIFGANYGAGGAIILDLNTDPMNPTPVGIYDENYFHDGVVRGDTLWGGAIYQGDAQVVDVSEKGNPILLSSWKTPSVFTHNIWFSDDNRYVYTTDEVMNGSIAAYNVEDIYNPTEVDKWMPADTSIIPHNTHFINDYLVTSHYTIGINIIDVKRPQSMIETGYYDTSPSYTYEGFHGCWGAYPYLPSGKVLATDIEEGLYVFRPSYKRGCYLEGNITNQHTGEIIFFPTIEIIETDQTIDGDIVGKYATATLDAGSYTVKVSADGYYSKTVEGVELENGELTILDVGLSNWPLGLEEQLTTKSSVIYPNPSFGMVHIQSNDQIERVEVLTLNGQLAQVYTVASGQMSLDMNLHHLQAGVYVVRITGGGQVDRHQLIVE